MAFSAEEYLKLRNGGTPADTTEQDFAKKLLELKGAGQIEKMRSQMGVEKAQKALDQQKAQLDASRQALSGVLGGYDKTAHSADAQAGWADYLSTQEKIAQAKQQTEDNKNWFEKMIGYLGNTQDSSLPVHLTEEAKKGIRGQDDKLNRPGDNWSEDQRLTFGYLWNTDRQNAQKYARMVNEELNWQAEQAKIKQIQESATNSFGAGVGHTVGAVLSAPFGLADTMGDMLEMDVLGRLSEADGEVTPYEYSDAVKGGISQHLNETGGTLDEDIPIIGGKGWGDVYNIGTSVAQSMLAAHTGGAGQALITMFGPAVQSGINSAKSRGATDKQAMTFGLMTGLAEAMAEQIGVDNLLKLGAADTLKGFAINMLKQGAVEGLEEGITSVANNFADQLVMADKSEFYRTVQQLMAAGKSEAEAKKLAWGEMAEGILFDMLAGFASGTASGGIETGANTLISSATTQTEGIKNGSIAEAGQVQQAESVQSGETMAGQDGAPAVQQNAEPAQPAEPGSLEWVKELMKGGTVTNKQAKAIVEQPDLYSYVMELAGFESPATASGKRNAVKQAVAQIAGSQAAENTAAQQGPQAAQDGQILQTPTGTTQAQNGPQDFNARALGVQTVDTDGQVGYDNINTQGGERYGAEQIRQAGQTGRTGGGIEQITGRARTENGYRSAVQEGLGTEDGQAGQVHLLRQRTPPQGFAVEDCVTPPKGSALDTAQGALSDDYGIESYVIKSAAWKRDAPAHARNGKVYIREDIDNDTLLAVPTHEATHVMKQRGFEPYLAFAEKTPDLVDRESPAAQDLLFRVAEHCKIDIFSMDDAQMQKLYDEVNATVYGMYKSGRWQDEDIQWFSTAFYDFDAYIAELDNIHDQFKTLDARHRLQYLHGTMPEHQNAVRPDDLPNRDANGNPISRVAGNIKGAKITPDAFVPLLDRMATGGELSYVSITNDATTQKAMEDIMRYGWEGSLAAWQKGVREGKAGADMTATGALLLNNAAQAGDKALWCDILADMQLLGTNTAQGLQAFKIIKQLAPSDKLYMIRRSVEQMAKDAGHDLQIDENLARRYQESKTDAEADRILDRIAKEVAGQIKTTWGEKWTALRYLNMLGNFRTQIRNLSGNLTMGALNKAKNAVAVGIETLANKASGGRIEKTKSLTVDKDQLQSAKADYDTVAGAISNGGRYNDPNAQRNAFMQKVQDSKTVFRFKPLEGYRKATSWAMEQGDVLFSKSAYARALAGYLKAKGITETDLSKIDPKIMDDARLYAVKEAQEVTFRDNNWLSTKLSKIGRGKDSNKWAKVVLDGIIPFRKTPANVLIRAEQYSPLGLVNAIGNTVKAAKGDISANAAIESWAKGLTGSGVFFLGMLLYNCGLLNAGPDDDDKKAAFDRMNGVQPYSLQIGDLSFTIDWASPAAVPLLMGGEFMKAVGEDGFQLEDLTDALTSIADPMIEMSMLQGVNDTLENIKYSDQPLAQILVNAALNHLTQAITNTALGQIERSFESSRMQTYTDKNSELPDWLQKFIGKNSAKTIGWDYNQIPYINAWGEEEENMDPALGLFYNMLSPGYGDLKEDTPLTRELYRLDKAQGENVFPATPSKSFEVDGEKVHMTADQYVEAAKTKGQTQKRIVDEMISLPAYKALSDEEKATAVRKAYEYAWDYTKQEVFDIEISTKWMRDIEGQEAEAILAWVQK